MSRVLALLPAALLAVAAFWTGGFETATRFPAGAIGLAGVLALALPAARQLPDPLRLGRWGALLLPLGLALVAVSWAVSPIPRAGLLALVLLPAYLVLPAAVARLWRDAAGRRLGIAGIGLTVAAAASVGLGGAIASAWGRAAAPIGHHNLLAVFLIITLPVAAVGLRERGGPRAIAWIALIAGTAALAATRSLAAFGAVVVLGLIGSMSGALRIARGRDLVLGLALLALGASIPRLERIVRGEDGSVSARSVYAEAAWAGALERPWTGWGPGAVPWTLAGFLLPRPGVNPAGELVGEPHSTPLRLLFEVGVPATLLACMLFGLFIWKRRGDLDSAADRALLLAGLGGVVAGALAGLGGSWLAVPVLPLAWAIAAGAALAGAGRQAETSPSAGWLGMTAYAALAIWTALPLVRAQAAYGEAIEAEDPAVRTSALARAAALDPDFPLYAARAAWERTGEPRESARLAIEAARRGLGIEPLWLKAGALALRADAADLARPALERALLLDPLSAAPAFALFAASQGANLDCAARALLAEPKIAAATAWRGNEKDRRWAIHRAATWPGIDSEWGRQFERQARTAAPAAEGEERDIVYRIDGTPAVSSSLHLLRRPAWSTELLRIRVDGRASDRLRIGSATSQRSSSREAFPRHRCAPAGSSP